MKEVWAYVKWQHKVSENGIPFIVIYGVLGYILSDSVTSISNFKKFALLVIGINLLLFHFRSFWDKKVIREEKLIPLNKNKKIVGIVLYILIIFIPGLGVSYLCTNEYMFYIVIVLLNFYGIVIGIKSGKKPDWSRLKLERKDKEE